MRSSLMTGMNVHRILLAILFIPSLISLADCAVVPPKQLINAAGNPFTLTYANDEKTVINAFSNDYTTTDFLSTSLLMSQPDTPSLSSSDFFAFTQKNIDDAQQPLFYAVWTLEAAQNPLYKEMGEWTFFVHTFMEDSNFLCAFETVGCHNLPSLSEIKAKYPHRPTARLVYFTVQMFQVYHNTAVAVEGEWTRAQLNAISHVPKIISAFTRSPEPHRALVCKIVRATVQATFDLGMNLVTTALGGIPLPGFEMVFSMDMEILAEQSWRMFTLPKMKKGASFRNAKFADWQDGKFSTYINSLNSNGLEIPKQTKAINFNVLGHFRGAIPGWLVRVYKENRQYATKSLGLDSGYDKGGMCSAFRGEEKDRSGGNIVKLSQGLSDNMDSIRKMMRRGFREISRGQFVVENVPSAFAMIVMNNKWAGENSMRSNLENMEPVKDSIQLSIIKDIIGTTLSADGNFVSCAHVSNAPEMCKQAERGRILFSEGKKHPKNENGKYLHDATISFICPSTGDPSLICQPQRLYHAKVDTQIVKHAALNSFENFHVSGLNVTYESAITEMYEGYLLHGNDLTASFDNFASGNVSGVELRAPFCVHDSIKMVDFGGWILPHEASQRAWQVPACCGFMCRETQEVYKNIGLEIGSSHYNQREDINVAPQIFRDRIPRVLESFTPGLRYLAWGNAGIFFPDRNIPIKSNMPHAKWKFDVGIDKDFEAIKEATKDMTTEFQISLWFCRDGKYSHTVFDRERSHVYLANTPLTIPNSWTACQAWLKKMDVDMRYWDDSGRFN